MNGWVWLFFFLGIDAGILIGFILTICVQKYFDGRK